MWPREKLKRCGPEGVDCRFRVGLGLYYGVVSCNAVKYVKKLALDTPYAIFF